MIKASIKTEILKRLAAAETEHNVRIVYACESGSRAWGFASPDSDYDVRFLYVRPESWYLSFDVERLRDVIEYPIVDEIDCGGWDLKKALNLFARTNGALFEWLDSPITYIETGTTAQSLRSFAPEVFSPIALCYHYSHMAKSNAREYLFKNKVRLKKYFYVMRPLFAIRYIEAGLGIPPVQFQALVDAVSPAELKPGITKLLEIKSRTKELGLGDPIQEIGKFIESELERHGKFFSGQGRPDLHDKIEVRDRLNDIFRHAVDENSDHPA